MGQEDIKKNTLFVFSDLDTNVALNNVTVNGLITKVHFLDLKCNFVPFGGFLNLFLINCTSCF